MRAAVLNTKRSLVSLLVLLPLLACDKPDTSAPSAPSAPAPAASSAPPPAASVAAPTASATAAPSASAAASASSGAGSSSAPTKEANVVVRDPVSDKAETTKVLFGGTVTVYLPEWAGTSWTPTYDRTLGKPKDQTIPGFLGPTTPAHEFKWTISGPLLKAGQTHKVHFQNASLAKDNKDKPSAFDLTIEIVAS